MTDEWFWHRTVLQRYWQCQSFRYYSTEDYYTITASSQDRYFDKYDANSVPVPGKYSNKAARGLWTSLLTDYFFLSDHYCKSFLCTNLCVSTNLYLHTKWHMVMRSLGTFSFSVLVTEKSYIIKLIFNFVIMKQDGFLQLWYHWVTS
jgi:hypothetical protein